MITAAIQIAAALYVVWVALLALNCMSRSTPFKIRITYSCLLCGAVAAGAMPLMSHPQRDILECVLTVLVAIFFHCTRRFRHVT